MERTVIPSGCGIVGTVDCATSDEVFRAMVGKLAHRGPDGEGVWASPDGAVRFGHRRLAIVGVDERGAQPMVRGPLAVTCNGEIYNYLELRGELERRGYVFGSDCDTEVILHAYAEWGRACLDRLDGIFGFALYDGRRRRVILARDRLGVKPLHYACPSGGGLVFASEAKALLPHPRVPRRANLDQIRSDLVHGPLGPRQQTWLAGIDNLEPGTIMEIDVATGQRAVHVYWTPNRIGIDVHDEAEAVSLLRELFSAAVRRQLLSDVNVVTTCSGGIDSSAVTTLAARALPSTLDVFTVDYDEYGPDDPFNYPDESASSGAVDRWHALRLVESLPKARSQLVPLRSKEALDREHLDAVIGALEGTCVDLRCLTQAGVYKHIGSLGNKVALCGQAADEIWLGYYHYYKFLQFTGNQLSVPRLADYFATRPPAGYAAWRPGFLNPDLARACSRANLARNYATFEGDDPLNRFTYFMTRTHLSSLMHTDDRMGMLNSVEVRVPWADHTLTELSFRVPGAMKIAAPGQEKGKWLNRSALRGILPDHIVERSKMQTPAPPGVDRDNSVASAVSFVGLVPQNPAKTPSAAMSVNPPSALQDAMRALIAEDVDQLRSSSFLNELLTSDFIEGLPRNESVAVPELFTVYALWRFSELFGVS